MKLTEDHIALLKEKRCSKCIRKKPCEVVMPEIHWYVGKTDPWCQMFRTAYRTCEKGQMNLFQK